MGWMIVLGFVWLGAFSWMISDDVDSVERWIRRLIRKRVKKQRSAGGSRY